MKPIGIRGLNTRLRRLEKEFGADSEIVAVAKDYIAERIPKASLTDNGYIRQDRETDEKLGAKRWTSFDEYVPTVSEVYKREYEFAANEEPHVLDPNQQGPVAPYKLGKLSEAKKDPLTKNMLARHAEYSAHLLGNSSDIIDTLYLAKDDNEFPRQAEAGAFYIELCENAYLAKQLEWLNKVSDVTNAYLIWVSEKALSEEW